MAVISMDPTYLVSVGSFSINKTSKIFGAKVTDASSDTFVSVRGGLLHFGESDFLANTTLGIPGSRIIKYARSNGMTAKSTVNGATWKYKIVRASMSTESKLEVYTIERNIHADMHTYLPPLYNGLEDVQIMLDVEASEIIRIQAKLNEVLNQYFVNSATYGLSRWENIVGITEIPERSEESRRHFINAKLRGVGTVTTGLVKSVVDSFYYGEVTDKPREHLLHVKLLGKRGIPKNLEDIDVAVTDIIPAHLDREYEFTYATWDEMNGVGLTWQDAEEKTMKELEETFYVDPGFPYND